MGERAGDGSRRRGLPSAAVTVAAGAMVGVAVATPVAIAVAGDDGGTDVAVVSPSVTIEGPTTSPLATTTLPRTATSAPAALEVFDAVLTLAAAEHAAERPSDPIGTSYEGTTLTCTVDECTVELVIGRVLDTIVVPLVDGAGTGAFRYAIADSPCAGTGTAEGGGVVELVRRGGGFGGVLRQASDAFTVTERPGGGRCIGERTTWELVATPR